MNQLKTVDIKGKAYVTVNERIKYFREKFTGYSMTSEITHINDNGVIIKTTIKNDAGIEVASGHAHEKQNSTFINKTSFIENCETCFDCDGEGVASLKSFDKITQKPNVCGC